MKTRFLILPTMAFLTVISFTVILIGQQYSQQTRDAIQDRDIQQVTRQGEVNSAKLEALSFQLAEVKQQLERLNGIGIGFGSLLSGLLALDMFFRVRTAKRTG